MFLLEEVVVDIKCRGSYIRYYQDITEKILAIDIIFLVQAESLLNEVVKTKHLFDTNYYLRSTKSTSELYKIMRKGHC